MSIKIGKFTNCSRMIGKRKNTLSQVFGDFLSVKGNILQVFKKQKLENSSGIIYL